MPTFNNFTAPTGLDLPAIDLFVETDSGIVTNTRNNLTVRHNETNRIIVLPYQSTLQPSYPGGVTEDYLSIFSNTGVSNYAWRKYFITSMRISARPVEASADYAFDAVITAPGSASLTTSNAGENKILSSFVFNTSDAAYTGQVGHFVVTAMAQAVLDLSRSSLASGGNGSVPLEAQVSYVVSPGFGTSHSTPAGYSNADIRPRFYQTVTTILSRPFGLTYQAPLHRDASY